MQGKFIFLLYRLAQAAGFPLIVSYLLARGLKDHRYFRRLHERFGLLPASFRQTATGSLWLHAVSVGEVLSSIALLQKIRARFPQEQVYVSTATLGGRALAEQKLRGLADGVFYAPLDYCFAVRQVLRTLKPRAVIVLETEIWPNLYREAKRAGCALIVVNGRISDRTAPRYRAMKWFFRAVLQFPDAILAQDGVSRRRYLELGAPPEKVREGGNLKHDFDPAGLRPPEAVVRLLERLRPKEVWIAASTMPPADAGDVDEDEAVLEAFKVLTPGHPELLLMLVPRRPERFDSAAQRIIRAGIPLLRRSLLSEHTALPSLPCVLLVDTIGELSGLFQCADVVFMGGTLARRGGHNILEPAAFAKPIVAGPHMENFPSIIQAFRNAAALSEIRDPVELAPAVEALLSDRGLRESLGRRARRLAAAEQGAAAKALREIEAHYERSVPQFPIPWPLLLALWPLSKLWSAASRLKRRLDLARETHLATPVVSIGGISAGGAGKTPFVLWLAQALAPARPAILLRGYRRRSPETCTVLAPGEHVPASRTGDEAQIYLRAGVAPIGIGADRGATGRLIEQRFQPDVILLDDGFQHWRLARTLDIVLIDALDPFGGGKPLPLGRLRESPESLARADIIVLTRCEDSGAGIEARLRRYNASAPIFRSRIVPRAWVDARTGERRPLSEFSSRRVAAFCGLANPASFWRTLAALGCEPVVRLAFADHHRYRPGELRRLRSPGIEALLTTEKDIANLPDNWHEILGALPLYWLSITLAVEREQELLRLIKAAM